MNSLLVISSYPKKQSVHGRHTVGIASYAKNTLLALRKTAKKLAITVLAEEIQDDSNHTHTDITVNRTWKRNSFLTFPKLLKEIASKHKKEKTVLIEFELSMFGGVLHLLPFPLFLMLLKLLGKRIIIVNHQVIPKIAEIGPHINVSDHTLSSIFMSLGMRIFYTSMLLLANKVIVFEDSLKTRLSLYGSTRKIRVIPHGVEEFKSTKLKRESRTKLGIKRDEFVIVAFGYLAWYKGTDWLVHTVSALRKQRKGKNVRLIIAGGPNPNHLVKDFYLKYIDSMDKEALQNGITISGFVDQNDIPLYYNAADVLIFPYRTFMSASGPLSIAFSMKKPFLLSSRLKDVLTTKDLSEEARKLKINEKHLTFSLNQHSFEEKIITLKKSKQLQKKLTALSKAIGKRRSWNTIGKLYYDELFA